MPLLTTSKYISVTATLIFSSVLANADTFNQTYSGTLSDPGTVVQQTISLSSASQLLLDTTSYGGGANANGTTSTVGGFQPSLTLYTGAGTYVASQQISSPIAQTDPATTRTLDAYLLVPSLGAGNYIVTLTNWATQQSPTATNLSDGFVNFGGSTFADVGGAARTGTYALNVIAGSGAAAAAPEPQSLFLIASGLLAICAIGLKRKFYSQM